MRIVSRSEWGARYGDGVDSAPLPASEVWLHHTMTVAPDVVQPYSDDRAAIRRVEEIGAERFGDVYGFPYSFGVTPVGLIFGGHHIGQKGAHTYGRNHIARAIALVGNYDVDRPPATMLAAVAWLLVEGKRRGWWRVARLTGGHRDAPQASTACPGRYAYALIPEINRRAAALENGETDMDLSDKVNLMKPNPAGEKPAMVPTYAGGVLGMETITVDGALEGAALGGKSHAILVKVLAELRELRAEVAGSRE